MNKALCLYAYALDDLKKEVDNFVKKDSHEISSIEYGFDDTMGVHSAIIMYTVKQGYSLNKISEILENKDSHD